MSDNGPQISSQEFAELAEKNQFQHIMSSPLYTASNGQAKHTVQTAKHQIRNTEDPFQAHVAFRGTPLPW